MKVVFDGEILGKNYESSESGIYRVSAELLKNLYKKKDIELSLTNHCYNRDEKIQSKILKFLKNFNYNIPLANQPARRKFLPFRKEKLFKIIYKKIGISDFHLHYDKSYLKDADIYHSVFFPFDKRLQQFPNLKRVITIHDMIPFLFPNYDIGKHLDAIIESITEDDTIVCVSNHTKKDLVRLAPRLKNNAIHVVHLAASKELFYPCENQKKIESIKNKYAIKDKYFLSLSTLEPRKNIDFVIRNFIKFISDNNINDLQLVLVGGKGWKYETIFEAYENAESLKNKIIFTGHVENDELASIYSHAQSFYYMSFYEGFGLPPLEAMQCGVPVVVSNLSSLPEVVGDAGIMLDPNDNEALVVTMKDLYYDNKKRRDYSEKSLLQAAKFSWEKTADEYLEIYKKIIN
ncbi:glycosyltransferase family 4 protein [Chryseobacterium sp. POL2]|uniref:glycosyltransferase family 4 protein n=1 Tax=Chryseobacterium sp. POL2 TaxID=2713414 RepID=UPI0013E126FD|nr:glycosyltransferase family 1 protein [Chryseobacterium sp. POL2]QIG90506.1 glycosyltransferase family 4 protein [Chryseobacterium sp. POL2]